MSKNNTYSQQSIKAIHFGKGKNLLLKSSETFNIPLKTFLSVLITFTVIVLFYKILKVNGTAGEI
jgi:hypothetical protein